MRSSSDKENADSKDQPLEMAHVVPMILALVVGLTLAILTFACELSFMAIACKNFGIYGRSE